MSENLHHIKSVDVFRTIGELRFAPVRHVFAEAFRRSRQQRKMMLDQAMLLAVKIADDERSCQITGHHILSGMLRQGWNTGTTVFRKLNLSQRQMRMLARLPVTTN